MINFLIMRIFPKFQMRLLDTDASGPAEGETVIGSVHTC